MTALSRSLLILHVRGGATRNAHYPAFEAHSDSVSLSGRWAPLEGPGESGRWAPLEGPGETEPLEPLGAA